MLDYSVFAKNETVFISILTPVASSPNILTESGIAKELDFTTQYYTGRRGTTTTGFNLFEYRQAQGIMRSETRGTPPDSMKSDVNARLLQKKSELGL